MQSFYVAGSIFSCQPGTH